MADRASPELYDIRRRLRALNDRVRDRLNAIIRSSSLQKYLQDAIITMRNGRYVIPVRADSRQYVPGLVHDQSAAARRCSSNRRRSWRPATRIKQWTLKERQEIDRILGEFTDRVAPDADLYRHNIEVLANLDMIFARAALAREMRAAPPKINEESRVNLMRARHPLIDPEKVVPSTLWMGGEFTTLVITGPNTGGKTVTLKTVGLLALMAQSGLQIPAAYGSELPVFDEVFADIGDEQSIEQSLSTFSSHMTNIVAIPAGGHAPVAGAVDELRRGHRPHRGSGVGHGHSRTPAFHEDDHAGHHPLQRTQGLRPLHVGGGKRSVEFDVETLRPTYRLSIGVPGKSTPLKFPASWACRTSSSRRQASTSPAIRSALRTSSPGRSTTVRSPKRSAVLAEEAHQETQKLRDEAERLQKQIESRRERRSKRPRRTPGAILQKAQRDAEQVISELKRKSAATVKEHELHNLRAQLQDALDANTETIQPPRRTRAARPRTSDRATVSCSLRSTRAARH